MVLSAVGMNSRLADADELSLIDIIEKKDLVILEDGMGGAADFCVAI